MLEELKKHKSSHGIPVSQYLRRKYPNGEWIEEDDLIIYRATVAHLPVVYKWSIDDGRIKAIKGKAVDLTPDLYDRFQDIEKQRAKVPTQNLKIYDFIRYRFGEHGDEELSFEEAAKEFGLNKREIEAIYYRVDEIIYRSE